MEFGNLIIPKGWKLDAYSCRVTRGGLSTIFSFSLCVVLNNDICASLQRKGSNDKRGWSFRKKSAQQRVLSNTVTLETPSGNKESPESASFSYPPPASSNVQEKFSAIQSLDEKPQLSTSPKTKVMETIVVCENDSKLDLNTEESVVIVIQAAIRGFLVFFFSRLYVSKTH